MKLFWKLIISLLIIGILLPFSILKGKDGKPLINFGDLKIPEFSMPALPESSSSGDADAVITGSPNLIYEWKDAEGNLEFSNSPPADGIEFTVREYDPNTNVIQSIELPSEEAEVSNTEPKTDQKILSSDSPGDVYSPEQIKKLIDDAKNVENLLNERLKNQEAITGQ